jgi:predicted ATPase
MRRYILTGTPGCGKTSLIRALEMTGASVVAEAATDIIAYKQMQGIAEPWTNEDFIDYIVRLQKHRQIDLSDDYSDLHFYDRSPICTYALAMYLNFNPSANLMQEIERIKKHSIYDQKVFFIDNLGFIENTDARQISFEESLKFEKIHLDAYKKFGFSCIHIPAGSIEDRVKLILEHVSNEAD